jgi:hypothetical protein
LVVKRDACLLEAPFSKRNVKEENT